MFVCHGNICRSPMAEFVFKDIVKNDGKENCFIVRSCATSNEETGNPVYPPARAELEKHGISCDGKFAVRLLPSDYEKYDLFVCMDSAIRLVFSAATRKGKLKNFSVLQAPIATLPIRGITADLTKLTTIFLPGAKRCLLI